MADQKRNSKLRRFTNEYLVSYVKECKQEADDAAKPLRSVWRELWQAYQNKQDTTKKASWQSKAYAPKVWMQIERAAGEVKRAVVQTRKLFRMELDDYEDRERLQELQEELALTIDPNRMGSLQRRISELKKAIALRQDKLDVVERKFKRSLAAGNLTQVYSLVVKSAFLLGLGVIKVLWDAKRGRTKYEHVDTFNISISPDYRPFQDERPPYVIEYKRMKLARLLKLARDTNAEAGRQIYDMRQVRQITEDAIAQEQLAKERMRLGQGDRKSVGKDVEILEFWGDVISEDGKHIEENVLMQVANGKYLIRVQKPQPFNHNLPPYVFTMPIPYPHRGQGGVSLVQPQVRLNYTFNNILNMYVDNLNYSINKVFEYNPTDLQNPKALTAIYPGKKIPVTTEGGKQAIREVLTTNLGRDPLYALELIDKIMQEGTSVTEFLSGWPGGKAKTLGEVELKTAQSRGMFDVIARDLEENSLRPILEMSYDLYAQFADYDPREGNYTFSVGGVSLILMQRQLVDRVTQILAMSLQSPDLRRLTEVKTLWRKLLSIYNLGDVFVEPDTTQERISPEQIEAVQRKAEADAKRDVARLTPEEIIKLGA